MTATNYVKLSLHLGEPAQYARFIKLKPFGPLVVRQRSNVKFPYVVVIPFREGEAYELERVIRLYFTHVKPVTYVETEHFQSRLVGDDRDA